LRSRSRFALIQSRWYRRSSSGVIGGRGTTLTFVGRFGFHGSGVSVSSASQVAPVGATLYGLCFASSRRRCGGSHTSGSSRTSRLLNRLGFGALFQARKSGVQIFDRLLEVGQRDRFDGEFVSGH
jgi:hypothetical protein